jgi:hypothetical protein
MMVAGSGVEGAKILSLIHSFPCLQHHFAGITAAGLSCLSRHLARRCLNTDDTVFMESKTACVGLASCTLPPHFSPNLRQSASAASTIE